MHKLRRVNVFDRKPSVRSDTVSPLVSAQTNAIVAADGSVWMSTRAGELYRLDRGLQVSQWSLSGFPIVRGLRATKHQVVVWGREGSEEFFRAYHIFKLSTGGIPTKLRDGKISARATAFDVSHSMAWAALGLETGQVLLARGGCDFSVSRGFVADKKQITALSFVEKDSKVFLFVCTEASVSVFNVALDGSVTTEISDHTVGVRAQNFLARSGGLVFLGSDAAIFTFDPTHGNVSVLPREATPLRGLFAWRGFCGELSENISVLWSHGSSKFLAFAGNFSSPISVVGGAFDGRSMIVFESSGEVTEIVENNVSDQIKLLAKKHLYETAIDLATRENQSAETISDLHKMHADHLMSVGNFQGAISVFSRAMEKKLPLEISHVVRTCLSRPGVDGVQAIIHFLTKFPAISLRTQELVIACYKMIGNTSGLQKYLASLSDDELINHVDELATSELLESRANSSPQLFLPVLSARGNHELVAERLLKLPLKVASDILEKIHNKDELVVAHPEIARRLPGADRILIHGSFLRGDRIPSTEVLDYEDEEGMLMALEVSLRAKDADAAMKIGRLAVTRGLAKRVLVLANMFGDPEISDFAAKAGNISTSPTASDSTGRAKTTMGILREARRTAHMSLGEVKGILVANLRKSEVEVVDKNRKISEDEREIQKMIDERNGLLTQQRIIQPQNKQCVECKRNLLESSLVVYFNCGHYFHVHCATGDLKDPPVCRLCSADAVVKKKLRISRAVSCTKEDEMIKYLSSAENKFAVLANYAGRGLFASLF